jgi:hypothetical protein
MTRQAVVVLGMHRSGTSMLARLLVALGVDFGKRLLTDEVPDNQIGYWEQADIVELQEAILDRLDRTWYGPNGHLALPEGWRSRPDIVPLLARLSDILTQELDQARGLWGFKDPRTARLLPFWQAQFTARGVQALTVLAVRHPAAVCGSLLARNSINGMTLDRAQRLWQIHNRDILLRLGDAGPAAVVDYDGWFARPAAALAGLCSALSLPAPEEAAVAPLIRADLRHESADGLVVSSTLLRAYEALRDAAMKPSPAALRRALAFLS